MNAWSVIFLALAIAGVYSLAWQFSYQQRTKIMSQATDRLTASFQAATASVEVLIARIGTIPAPPPVDEMLVLAAADALDELKTKVDAVLPQT